MWATDLGKQTVVLLLLLLYFFAHSSVAQEGSGASPVAPDAGKILGAQNAGTQAQPPALQEKSSKSQPGNDANVPFTTGLQSHVLKEGEKLPERKNPNYENWGTPALTPGMRVEVVPLGRANGDGFTRELWSVQWRELDPIDLWVIKPVGVTKPPVILYLYSYDATNSRYKSDEFCNFLTRNGFAAVGFVSALGEQRFHDRPMKQTFVSELQESLATTAHDVQMILNFLAGRGDLDMNRVGMWADGSGASIAIMAAAVDARIKALDLLDPWGDWPDWLAKSSVLPEDQRAQYMTPDFLGMVADLEPLKWFPKLKTPKVRLQYVKEGVTATPAIAREKMEAAAPSNVEIVQYEDRKKFITEVAAKGSGFDWIKENVPAAAHPQNDVQSKAKAPLDSKRGRFIDPE
jgi:hypothetical protein